MIRMAKHYISICCMYKNEALYLAEWIEYHRIIGVDHFYLYDNLSDDYHEAILEPYIRAGIFQPIFSLNLQESSRWSGTIHRLTPTLGYTPTFQNQITL